MRIIEWSSEVCSSDLTQFANAGGWLVSDRAKQQRQLRVVERRRSNQQLEHDGTERIQVAGRTERFACDVLGRHVQRRAEHTLPTLRTGARSDEHTSELQSLMRRSYADLCLKKKTN